MLTRGAARLLLFAAAVLAAGVACGAEPSLLEGLRAQFARHAVVRADFIQEKRIQGMTRLLVSEGRFVYARDQGVVWQVERPYRAAYVLMGTHLIEVAADGSRRIIAVADLPGLAEVSRVFRAVLGGDTAALAEQFRIEASGSLARWQLRLTPRSDAFRKAIPLIVLAGSEFLERVDLDEAAGDHTAIRLQRTRPGDALSADESAAFKVP
jgi:outer membrane lipoprotein-sorting protein